MKNVNESLNESFNKEEILALYQKEFENLSESFLLDYMSLDDFKHSLKNKIRSYIFNFFSDYKPKNSAIGDHFSFGYHHAINENLFLNALIDDYIEVISNDVLKKILGGLPDDKKR